MAAPAFDPATAAYLRDLVKALRGKTFDHACKIQIASAADAFFAAADLFRFRPNPPILTGIHPYVSSAIATIESLLRIGSPTLDTYQRHLIRTEHEQLLAAAMAEFEEVNGLMMGTLRLTTGTAFSDAFGHLEIAKARVDAIHAATERIPGDGGDDHRAALDAARRFQDSAAVLRRFVNVFMPPV
uniref:Uncharacterized protein n=1 Tax=Leersia perrieri TaxID=77586 RepID=A0A0D9XZN0_9ORYZ